MTISRPAARRGLTIYLATVAVLSAPIEFGIIATDALADLGTSVLWLTGLMLVPTVGSVVARLADVGGRTRLFSSPGSGTTVVLEVPK